MKNPVGGGGKGQQVISAEALLARDARDRIVDALAKLWAETGEFSDSGDDRKGILLELNIHRPLHWEVQIFGDGDSVVHFAARDCSFQNHGYQKFIETSLHQGSIDEEIQKLDRSTDDKRIANLQQRKASLAYICAELRR
jgi:3-methylcrotonyl-CoA carboxylase alpha subunit